MLYETLNHSNLLLIFTLVGIIGGLVFDVGNFIKFLCANKKFAIIFMDIIQTLFVLLILFISNLNYNYGKIRLFTYIIFIISFTLYRISVGKLVAKGYKVCYNFINKLFKRVKSTNDKTNKNS